MNDLGAGNEESILRLHFSPQAEGNEPMDLAEEAKNSFRQEIVKATGRVLNVKRFDLERRCPFPDPQSHPRGRCSVGEGKVGRLLGIQNIAGAEFIEKRMLAARIVEQQDAVLAVAGAGGAGKHHSALPQFFVTAPERFDLVHCNESFAFHFRWFQSEFQGNANGPKNGFAAVVKIISAPPGCGNPGKGKLP